MESRTVEIWGRASSGNVQKVLWALEELGIEYHHIPAGGKYGVIDSDEFKALNPNQLVPTIRDDSLVMYESNAIVRYLA